MTFILGLDINNSEVEMKYEVYYNQNTRDAYFMKPAFSKEVHSKVAELEADNVEEVFRRMNVVDGDPEYELPIKLEIRSMMVGDVVIDENGDKLFCAKFGWEKV